MELQTDNTPQLMRVLQLVGDLRRRDLKGMRVLDLACAHGAYSIELARLGANVLGIEGREAWLERANQVKNTLGLTNVEFLKGDVRSLSKARHGEFDVILCLGILYHLDVPDSLELLANVADCCRDFAVVETLITHNPSAEFRWRDRAYSGLVGKEHPDGATPQQKLSAISQSLDNDHAFVFTVPSLSNALRHVGFSTVLDCRVPSGPILVGPERKRAFWGTRVTMAALKGVELQSTASDEDLDWPEKLDEHLFENIRYQPGVTVKTL